MGKYKANLHLYILVGILASRITSMLYGQIISVYGLSAHEPFYMHTGNFLYSLALCVLPAVFYFKAESDVCGFMQRNLRRIKMKKLLFCIFFGICMWCAGQLANSAANIILKRLGIYQIKQISDSTHTKSLIMGFFMVCIAGPVAEELLYRGVLWEKSGHISPLAAIFFASFVFALAHGSITVFVMPLIYGAAAGYIMYRYKNIIYPVIMHMMCNVLAWLITVCKIPDATMRLLNSAVILIGIVTISYVFVMLMRKRKTVIRAAKEAFLAFISNILWIIIIADCFLRNLSFHA